MQTATLTIADLAAFTYAPPGEDGCATYWGSHGCDRLPGHELPHVCGTPDDEFCSVHDGESVRFVYEDGLSAKRYPMTLYYGP